MTNSIKTRFKDAVWANTKEKITIGGAGGIGSWLSLLLSRTEQDIVIWDDDIIDESNMSGQLYQIKDIGQYKVTACEQIAHEFSGWNFIYTSIASKLTEKTALSPICFSAFDNMEARKNMFESWVKYHSEEENAIFIDGRMLMESGQIFCVTKENIQRYREEYLFEDYEVPAVDCSTKATSHCGAFISSLMVSFFTNHVTNLVYKDKIREVPFKFEFELPIANFNLYEK